MPAVALIDGLIHRNPSDTQLPRLPQAGPTTDSFRSLLERTNQSTNLDQTKANAPSRQEESHQFEASNRSEDSEQSARERLSYDRQRENLRRAEEQTAEATESDRRASIAEADSPESRGTDSAKAESNRQIEQAEEAAGATEMEAVVLLPEQRPALSESARRSVGGDEGAEETTGKSGELDQSRDLEAQVKAAEAKAPAPKDGRKAPTDNADGPSGKLAQLLKQLEPVETEGEAGGREKLIAAAAEKRDAESALRLSQKAQAANLELTGNHTQKGATSELRGEERDLRGRTARSDQGEEQGERKVRVVDLRAPRAGERSGSGQERQEGGGNQNGLKESGESALSAENRLTANRADGGESAFARQFGLTAESGREMGGQRIVQQQQLHRFLRESGYGEIVRNARVMLREGGNGEIRLNLSPKELGSVRVQLQLQDSHIAGRIIVENSTVREVFEQNLDQLQKAFQSQGLETGRLEVAVQERGEGQQRQDRGRPGRGGGARIFEEHTALVTESFYEDSQVNLMA